MSLGDRLRAAGGLLSHPFVSMAGNALTVITLISFLFALGAAVVGRMADEPVLFVLAVALALFGFVGTGILVLLQRRSSATATNSAKGPPLDPGERLKIMDDMFYPPADPRRELGEECRAFAITVRVWVEEYEVRRIPSIASAAEEAVAADPDLDMEQAHKDAQSLVERNLEAEYALKLRDEGLSLFDQARQQDAIAAKYRREVEHPNAYALEEVANMFRAIARRLGVDVPEPEPIPKAKYLAESLDALIREGMDLRQRLEAPVEPEETSPGTWRIDGGVPEGWWEKVDAFDGRIRELLRAERPALLGTYAESHNASARRLRQADENRESPDHKADRRSSAQKVLAFANGTRKGPMLHMDCILDGLGAARRQLGLERQ